LDLSAFVKHLAEFLNRKLLSVSSLIFFFLNLYLLWFFIVSQYVFRYVIQMLPLLLVSFSDQVVAVREAAECAARAMMSQLTAQGVKLVLPSLLKVINIDYHYD